MGYFPLPAGVVSVLVNIYENARILAQCSAVNRNQYNGELGDSMPDPNDEEQDTANRWREQVMSAKERWGKGLSDTTARQIGRRREGCVPIRNR